MKCFSAKAVGHSLPLDRLALAFAVALALAGPLRAADPPNMVKPGGTTPGGLGIQPVVTSIASSGDLVTVKWFGLQGPYQLQGKASTEATQWVDIGTPTFGQEATFPKQGDLAVFRVNGAPPNYIGASACLECHPKVHGTWQNTGHARALDTLKAIGQQNNSQCLLCHTVGYGTPTGFQSEAATPQLAGVQCENCHGAALNHIALIEDVSVRPKVTPASEACGGCHNGFHHPTYDEWKTSGHAVMDADVAESILAQGESRMLACGPCHSGAVRLALLRQLDRPTAPLPSREDAAYFPVTCAVCHEPHDQTGHAAQLRNPTFSTNHFSYSTSTNTSFAKQYDPSVQVCGQCHNMRGARWQDTSRPPHHSPQYNLLIGQGAYDLGAPLIATHGAKIQQQCAHCHTHPHEAETPSPTNPNYTGHSFEVHFEGCTSSDPTTACHGSAEDAEAQMGYTRNGLERLIGEVKGLLDQWATTKAPPALSAKYGPLAWEYTNPGQLSNPSGSSDLRGPTTAEQEAVPDAIKQARFNLYLVEHDASYGSHNARYARRLLGIAKTNVVTAIGSP